MWVGNKFSIWVVPAPELAWFMQLDSQTDENGVTRVQRNGCDRKYWFKTSSMTALTAFNSIIDLTDEQFFQLCQVSENLRFERTATGELIIMPPAERRNGMVELTQQLFNWADTDKHGIAFKFFRTVSNFPMVPDRSPMPLGWNLNAGILLLLSKKRDLSLFPDFLSSSYSRRVIARDAQAKMNEYRDNSMGWLRINRKCRQVNLSPQSKVELLQSLLPYRETILFGYLKSWTQSGDITDYLSRRRHWITGYMKIIAYVNPEVKQCPLSVSRKVREIGNSGSPLGIRGAVGNSGVPFGDKGGSGEIVHSLGSWYKLSPVLSPTLST